MRRERRDKPREHQLRLKALIALMAEKDLTSQVTSL
jgi:hypothetical protein